MIALIQMYNTNKSWSIVKLHYALLKRTIAPFHFLDDKNIVAKINIIRYIYFFIYIIKSP